MNPTAATNDISQINVTLLSLIAIINNVKWLQNPLCKRAFSLVHVPTHTFVTFLQEFSSSMTSPSRLEDILFKRAGQQIQNGCFGTFSASLLYA